MAKRTSADVPRETRTKRDRQLFDQPDAKPPYRVPSMEEVAQIPWNGLTVVSTFAGAGGSSLGYRMAGFRVLWANEFVPIAQESYRLNMRPGTILDGRDIKTVTARDILKATKLKRGELDVLDGSPPCQAFSTAGKREQGWGEQRKYAHGAEQQNELLFYEYIRLLDGLEPRAFIAENVAGLVKGAAKGFFLDILAKLKTAGPGYRVKAIVADAQWLGVPQHRPRVIYVGVREDLQLEPAFPTPLPYRYSVRDALPWIGRVGFENGGHNQAKHQQNEAAKPIRTLITSAGNHFKVDDVVVAKNKNAAFAHKNKDSECDEVSPTVMGRRANLEVGIRTGSNGSAGRRMRGEVASIDEPSAAVLASGARSKDTQFVVTTIERRGSPGGRKRGNLVETVDTPAHAICANGYGGGARNQVAIETRVVHDPGRPNVPAIDVTDGPSRAITGGNAAAGGGPANHFRIETRKVAQGEHVADNVGASLEGYAIGKEWDRLNPGGQSDRFFSLVKAELGEPCPAITSSGAGAEKHGVPGGVAAVVHPTEKRKFTILEVKRLCSFPDDFQLAGSYGQQWERLGNSVPPIMAMWIGAAIRDKVLLPWHLAQKTKRKKSTSGPAVGGREQDASSLSGNQVADTRGSASKVQASKRTESRSRSPKAKSPKA